MRHHHYHVFAGAVGCLQDSDATFATKRDAERYLVAEATDYREAGITVTGNVRRGYEIGPIGRLYLEGCEDPRCELLLDLDRTDPFRLDRDGDGLAREAT